MHFQALSSLALLAVVGSAMPHSAEDMHEHHNHQVADQVKNNQGQLHELVLNQAQCPEGQNSVNGNGVQYCCKGEGKIEINNEKVTVPDYCSKMEPTQSQTTALASTNGAPAPTASTGVASAANASSSTKAPSMTQTGNSSAATATATATAKSGASRMVTGASILLTTLVGFYLVN